MLNHFHACMTPLRPWRHRLSRVLRLAGYILLTLSWLGSLWGLILWALGEPFGINLASLCSASALMWQCMVGAWPFPLRDHGLTAIGLLLVGGGFALTPLRSLAALACPMGIQIALMQGIYWWQYERPATRARAAQLLEQLKQERLAELRRKEVS